jgi:hypothetical protein
MEVALALLADAANATANNKLNVLGVFGNINPPMLPHRHPSMTLVLKFDADSVEGDTDKNIQIVLVDPDGRELNRLEIQGHVPPGRVPGAPIEMIMQVSMNGLKFERAGPHAFVVLVNGETKKRVPLNVTAPVIPPQETGGEPGDSAPG